MKVALIYATKTGHSKKIALAIEKEFRIQAMDIKTNPKLESVDLLYILGGVYGAKSAPELIEFVRSFDSQQVKRVALMTSSAGKTITQKEIRTLLVNKGIAVLEDEFTCQGGFLFVGVGHPNVKDISNAIEFVKRTI